MDLKPPLNYEQQIEHLINFHKLTIEDPQKAKEILNIFSFALIAVYDEKGTSENGRVKTDLYTQIFTLSKLLMGQ